MTIFSCERETDTLFAIVVVPDYNRARTKSGRSEHEKRDRNIIGKMPNLRITFCLLL